MGLRSLVLYLSTLDSQEILSTHKQTASPTASDLANPEKGAVYKQGWILIGPV